MHMRGFVWPSRSCGRCFVVHNAVSKVSQGDQCVSFQQLAELDAEIADVTSIHPCCPHEPRRTQAQELSRWSTRRGDSAVFDRNTIEVSDGLVAGMGTYYTLLLIRIIQLVAEVCW